MISYFLLEKTNYQPEGPEVILGEYSEVEDGVMAGIKGGPKKFYPNLESAYADLEILTSSKLKVSAEDFKKKFPYLTSEALDTKGMSNGHLAFSGEHEYFSIGNSVYRAPIAAPIDLSTGNRGGARLYSSVSSFEQMIKNANVQLLDYETTKKEEAMETLKTGDTVSFTGQETNKKLTGTLTKIAKHSKSKNGPPSENPNDWEGHVSVQGDANTAGTYTIKYNKLTLVKKDEAVETDKKPAKTKKPIQKKDYKFYIVYRHEMPDFNNDGVAKYLGKESAKTGYADVHWPGTGGKYLKEIFDKGQDFGNDTKKVSIGGVPALYAPSSTGSMFLHPKDAKALEGKSVETEYGRATFVYKPMGYDKEAADKIRSAALGLGSKAESLLNKLNDQGE